VGGVAVVNDGMIGTLFSATSILCATPAPTMINGYLALRPCSALASELGTGAGRIQ
jgi:hypothetical protein